MLTRMVRASAWLLLLGSLAWMPAASAAEGGKTVSLPSRGRATALLTALFYHDAGSAAPAREQASVALRRDVSSFASVPPKQAHYSRERARVVDFARSLIYEGGFYPQEIYQLLGYNNATTARIARLSRQIDMASDRKPDPWEVAGRVGRSGISGASDHWAMAPGKDGVDGISSPGTLAYLPALAVVYAAYPDDGREAAAQLAILKDDDLRAAPAARAAFSLLTRVLVATDHDKDAWLRDASRDSRDPDTERDIRSVRVKDWRYLRGEECAMGRLERAIFLWYKGENYQDIMLAGREQLRSRESLAYLAALAAVTYGMESLPNRVIASGASDRQLLDLVNDLHDLATGDAVLRVKPEQE